MHTFFAQNSITPRLYWESDIGVTGSPASAWKSRVGQVALSQGTGANQPAVTASAFGSTQGLTFDGSNDSLAYSGAAVTTTGAASLSVVFKTGSSVTGPFVLLSQSDSATTNNYWEFGIGADGKLYVTSNVNGTALTIQGATVLATATVYNAILCYDGTDYYLQLNGTEENPLVVTSVGAYAWLGGVGGTTVFTLGATTTSGGTARYFNGVLGGVYFWNQDLTA